MIGADNEAKRGLRVGERPDRVPSVDMKRHAMLLDVDGTLIDIAPAPDDVRVPECLKRSLEVLASRMDGAVALVSGRPVAALDALFAPLELAAIGCHGAEMRAVSGADTMARVPALGENIKQAYSDISALEPGVRVEDKTFSLAFHYRNIPDRETALLARIRERSAAFAPQLTLLQGKAVIEVKSGAFNKGEAVQDLMCHDPFAGRRPVFLGDDTTDDDVFAILGQIGGTGVCVGRRAENAEFTMVDPPEVRRWLAGLAAAAGTAQL